MIVVRPMIIVRPVVVARVSATVIGVWIFTVNPYRHTGWHWRADDAPCCG
jgi:hypothetical protein